MLEKYPPQKEIEEIIEQEGKDRTALINIIQKVQRRYNHVSDFAMQTVADKLNIHPSEVYGVVSFYAFLNENPKGNFIIRLCRTISCDMAGKQAIADKLSSSLGIKFGETTSDGMFTLEWTNCMGMCDQGPAMMVNEKVFTHVTPEKVEEVIGMCRQSSPKKS